MVPPPFSLFNNATGSPAASHPPLSQSNVSLVLLPCQLALHWSLCPGCNSSRSVLILTHREQSPAMDIPHNSLPASSPFLYKVGTTDPFPNLSCLPLNPTLSPQVQSWDSTLRLKYCPLGLPAELLSAGEPASSPNRPRRVRLNLT